VDLGQVGDTDDESSMLLTFLTVLTAAALGGAVAVDLTALVIAAAVALALLGAVNGLRTLGALSRFLRT